METRKESGDLLAAQEMIESVGLRDGGTFAAGQLWLHHRHKRTCWYFKALYEYEAFVTNGPNPGDPRVAVDSIILHIYRPIDGANYNHTCVNTDYCAKSDEIFHTGGACGTSCLNATATYRGVSWSTLRNCVG